MGTRRGYLGWIWRPQALVCFLVLCLSVGALGGPIRSAAIVYSPHPDQGRVNGASLQRLFQADCSIKACLALTFDDGPNSLITPQVLDILNRQQVKATFFVVGQNIAGQEALLRRTCQEGHEIGNHSWSHPDLTKLTPTDAAEQIKLTQKTIASAGIPAPRLLRPPYGAINDMVASHTRMAVIRWNIDTEDWKMKDSTRIHEKMLGDAKPGGIILLHDTHQTTASALEAAIIGLKPYYQFVTVSQLLGLSPGDRGQYFSRHH